MVKHLPTMRETQVQSLGREDLLEKDMATHSSILAWKIPWTEEPSKLRSMGSNMTKWMSTYCVLICCASSSPPETALPLKENIKVKLRTWRECSVISVMSDSLQPYGFRISSKKVPVYFKWLVMNTYMAPNTCSLPSQYFLEAWTLLFYVCWVRTSNCLVMT